MEGVEDPFFEQLEELYPGKGLKGFVEENPKLFKKTQESDINLASERYKKADGIMRKLGQWLKIPIIIGMALLYPEGIQHMHPLIYVTSMIGVYKVLIGCVFGYTGDKRIIHDNDIFDARCRIARDMGLLKEEDFRKSYSLADSYKFDYAKEDQEKSEE